MPAATLTNFGHPATLIGETEHLIVLLRPQQVTLGSLVLICRETVSRFGEVSTAALAGSHRAVHCVETILREFVRNERVN